MSLRVIVTKPARKELEDIPLKQRAKILSSLAAFVETGRGDIETIKPFVGEYRLRVGEWRVRFSLDAHCGLLLSVRGADSLICTFCGSGSVRISPCRAQA